MENSQMNVADGTPCACGNCEWRGPVERSLYINDLYDRLTPGPIEGEVPAGECPDCGSLAYVADEKTLAYKRLTAAAPDLLAVVRRLATEGVTLELHRQARDALEKATQP